MSGISVAPLALQQHWEVVHASGGQGFLCVQNSE